MKSLKDEVFMMVDLETLALDNPVVIEIGAVVFRSEGIIATFSESVCPESGESLGLTISPSTVKWWLETDPELFKEKMEGSVPIWDAVSTLTGFYQDFGCTKVMSNGSLADLKWIHQIVDKINSSVHLGVLLPWSFRDEMCFRTVKMMHQDVAVDWEGVRHDALDDAIWQSKFMIEVLNK